MELNQLVIARGAELHYEGSAFPPTEQGNPVALDISHSRGDITYKYYSTIHGRNSNLFIIALYSIPNLLLQSIFFILFDTVVTSGKIPE